MTAKRDLKKRVRARQARTGEGYVTARAHVLAARPAGRVPVVEAVDVSAAAAAVGLKGRILILPDAADHVDVRKLLRRIREVLNATEDDPATARLRAFLLQGRQLPPLQAPSLRALAEMQRFFARARAGIAGVSESGRSLALSVQGKRGLVTVVCLLWGGPIAGLPGHPTCVILRPEEFLLGTDARAGELFLLLGGPVTR